MATAPAFTINNYIPKSETIELDEEPTQIQRIRFSAGRRGKRVSPTPSFDTFMARNSANRTRRGYSNILLALSGLFSLVSFTLVLGLFLGFIQPRNVQTCKCTSLSHSGKSGALKVDEYDKEQNELQNDIETIKNILEAQKEKMAVHDDDIKKINEKISQVVNEIWVNTSKVSNVVKTHYSKVKKFVNETREELSQSKNITSLKLNQITKEVKTNMTITDQKTNEVIKALKKLSVHTILQFKTARNSSWTMFQRFQRDNERNFTSLRQNIDDLSVNLEKHENETSNKMKANLKSITKSINNTQKRISENEVRYSAKFKQIRKEVWSKTSNVSQVMERNHLEVKQLVNETEEQIWRQSRQLTSIKIHELKQELQTNLTKVSQETDDVTIALKQLSIDINGQFEKTKNLSKAEFQQLKTNNARNFTSVVQSIDELSQDLLKLENDTNNKARANLNTINKLLDPNKFQGPRGYNGSVGQQGPVGPAGPPGPPMTVDFTNCQHGIQTGNGDKDDFQVYAEFQDTKTHIMFATSCSSTISGGTVSKAIKKVTNGYKYTCTCDNHETKPKNMTCTLKYLLCKR